MDHDQILLLSWMSNERKGEPEKYYNVIYVMKIRDHNNYNINECGILFKITLCIMVTLYVETILHMI
jgi:hypothetical protein